MTNILTPPVENQKNKRSKTFIHYLTPVSGATNEIASLDGLRAVAVLMVIIDHIMTYLSSNTSNAATRSFLSQTYSFWNFGGTGVYLFFVLSGFLLFLPYSKTSLGIKKKPENSKFYKRRMLRILPGYWVSLFLIIVFFERSSLDPANWSDVLLHVFLIHNLNSNTFYSINGPFWTMAVEFQFYILLPLIASGIIFLFRKNNRFLFFGFFIVLLSLFPLFSLIGAIGTHNSFVIDHFTAFDGIKDLSVFGLGIIASLIYVAAKEGLISFLSENQIRRIARIVGLSGFIGLVFYLLLNLRDGRFITVLNSLGLGPIVGVCYTAILLGVVLGWNSWAKFLSLPFLRFIGIISYGLYIWNLILLNYLILPFAGQFDSPFTIIGAAVVLTLGLLIPFCYLFYMIVERPFIAARRGQH